MIKNKMFELTWNAAPPESSQSDIDLQAVFSNNNETITVKGFYDGDGKYIVRFLPNTAGEYTWKVSGIINAAGSEICEESAESGVIRAVGTYFEDMRGKPFFPFGTTVYALCYQSDALIEETLQSLQRSPFNKVRLSIFPKYYDYSEEEPELFPFEKTDGKFDVNKPCFAFWRRLEKVILALQEYEIQTDLILFHSYDKWGFKSMTMQENYVYLDYAIRRLAAIPSVWWSIANEYNLVFARSLQDWGAIDGFISENDPFRHLASVHNCFAFYDFTRTGITHCSVQSNQIESASKFLKQYGKPLIYDECGYEGDLPQNWGNFSGFELVNDFWTVMAQGAYCTHGETFLSDDNILWWAKGGKLKGSSVPRIEFLRRIWEEIGLPLMPWEPDRTSQANDEFKKVMADPAFFVAYKNMPAEQRESCFVKNALFCGRSGDEVFVQYLGKHCCARIDWMLPEKYRYDVKVIDVWEMTEKVVMESVCGKVRIQLPGKEGMAIIAYRRKDV